MLPAVAPASIAAWSASALDRELAGDAEVLVVPVASDAILLGAFQRRGDVSTDLAVFRRGSGGAAVRVGAGSIYVGLALRRHDALIACEPARMTNRYVRPLLRALTKCGAKAEYAGRDWFGVLHRPAGTIGFAHDATTGRALVEMIVAVSTPFSVAPRASFLEKLPGSIDEIVGRPHPLDRIADALSDAYTPSPSPSPWPAPAPEVADEPPWTSSTSVPIGTLSAGRDASATLRLGGELMASRDGIARLEAALALLPLHAPGLALAPLIDAALASPGVVVEGLASLTSVLEVIRRAL